MKLHTKAVHAGDRRQPSAAIPVTTPIYTATSFFYHQLETLDRVFADEEAGYCYSRYDNPTNSALEQLLTELEGGAGALATSSGMGAIHVALLTALTDRRRSIVASSALYGATIKLLMNVLEPSGVAVRWVDITNLDEVRHAVSEAKPGCLLTETISNPLLRVAPLDQLAEIARAAGAALVVDNTFATPLLSCPLELGAHLSVHSVTKYLAGHGDVLGGAVIADAAHLPILRTLAKTCGPNLGPFESYLTMRGIKTFPLRMERQCANACLIASWLASHPRIAQAHFPALPNHPDHPTTARLFPPGLFGAMVSFEIKDGGKDEVFRFVDALKMVVPATSLGDVHTMVLYPAMSSHRDLSPAQRRRLGIGDNLVRLSVGIEHPDDIQADLDQALNSFSPATPHR